MTAFNCSGLVCPICKGELTQFGGSLLCRENHTFDIARQGYVNLLPVQRKHSLAPGDTYDMLAARRAFLDGGLYEPICRDVADALSGIPGGVSAVADVGCGEGYYTAEFLKRFPSARIIGADISKNAVKMAASRSRDISWITATASHMPLADHSVDGVTCLFSLLCEDEFSRILRPGGRVIEVTAGTDHLIELKRVIYDEVFEQHKRPKSLCGSLCEISCDLRRFSITPDRTQLRNLLLMTPHAKRIKPENRARIESLPSMRLTVEYYIRIIGQASE